MLQKGQKGFGIPFHKEVEGLGLKGFGHLLQKASGRCLPKGLFQNIPGIIKPTIRHHLMGKAELIKLVQRAFHLAVGGPSHLCHLISQVLNVLLIQIFINLGCPVSPKGYNHNGCFLLCIHVFNIHRPLGCFSLIFLFFCGFRQYPLPPLSASSVPAWPLSVDSDPRIPLCSVSASGCAAS